MVNETIQYMPSTWNDNSDRGKFINKINKIKDFETNVKAIDNSVFNLGKNQSVKLIYPK